MLQPTFLDKIQNVSLFKIQSKYCPMMMNNRLFFYIERRKKSFLLSTKYFLCQSTISSILCTLLPKLKNVHREVFLVARDCI